MLEQSQTINKPSPKSSSYHLFCLIINPNHKTLSGYKETMRGDSFRIISCSTSVQCTCRHFGIHYALQAKIPTLYKALTKRVNSTRKEIIVIYNGGKSMRTSPKCNIQSHHITTIQKTFHLLSHYCRERG